ncbi:hypothetical protein NECAME_06062 [Necator americanus]|uniref:Uncharacterized protein n=1 Tax=Necator americanus TaxID=51031 RepID=W2TWN7_NECAM|nr:hypothetical protein NECAME_06062 [Necator americanus]ETN86089.1 hypothetical protein NECAME_06062 [Necator americanus]
MVFKRTKSELSTQESNSGFVFVRQLFNEDGTPSYGQYKSVGIPITSLVTSSFVGAGPRPRYQGHHYQNDFVTVYYNRECPLIGNFMLYRQQAYVNWTRTTLPPPELELIKMSTRRWFNQLRFHRRMAYPHTVHRAQRHNILRNWIKAFPAILCQLHSFAVLCTSSV